MSNNKLSDCMEVIFQRWVETFVFISNDEKKSL